MALVGAVLASIEAYARRSTLAAEFARKAAHVVIGLIAAALPWFMPFREVGIVAVIFMPVMLISRQQRWMPSVHGPERETWGELYFPLGILMAALVAPNQECFSFGVLVMTLSDAAAGIVGVRYGKRNLSLGPKFLRATKTLEGTTTFFAVTFVLALAFLMTIGQAGTFIALSALVIALALTYIEAVLGYGLDNLFLPVAGALLIGIPLVFGQL